MSFEFLFDDAGRFRGLAGHSHDLSEYRKDMAELRLLAAEVSSTDPDYHLVAPLVTTPRQPLRRGRFCDVEDLLRGED